MDAFLPLLALLIPGLPLLTGLCARRLAPAVAGCLVTLAAGAAFAAGTIAALAVMTGGPRTVRADWGLLGEPALRLDAVSVFMVLLAGLLGAVVLRFSQRYLAGDPRQADFFSWMSLTLGCVLALVLSGHLLLLLAAWTATSLCLHRLLLHFPERAAAVFAARKKFVISRLGEACVLAGSVLLYRRFGTFDIEAIFAAAAGGQTNGLTAATLLLAAGAAMKSAQFPFHSWLPDTMATPTPVSAFMHAGIINAGGYLLVRFSPLFVQTPVVLGAVGVVGAVTAAYGAIVMLAQPGVKRSLAYSTIAQMGFMMLQCGLGAFGLALLHLAAHACYKAHAFLTAGSTIGAVPRAAVPLRAGALLAGTLAGFLLASGAAVVLRVLAPDLGVPVFPAVVLAVALSYGLARVWSVNGRTMRSLGVAATAVLVALALHLAAATLFAGMPGAGPAPWLTLLAAVLFGALFGFQALLWRLERHPSGRRLYVHALNGFYLGTLANRMLDRLWPATPEPRAVP